MFDLRKRGASSFGLAMVVAIGMSAPTAEAQIFGSDPEGMKRTDALIKRAEELVKEAVSAREEIGKTLDSYNAIFEENAKDVRKSYKDVEKGMENSEKKRAEVRKKLEEMKTEADAYFTGWSQSLEDIQSPNLRERSEQRMAATRAQFNGVLTAVEDARAEYEPFMTSLKDQWTYLGHDLNASGIESLRPEQAELNEQAKELFASIDTGMVKANEYIEALRASRPQS